jgi:hypothetical protein
VTVPSERSIRRHNARTLPSPRTVGGVDVRPHRIDVAKEHPCLQSYSDLPEHEKEYDRQVSLGTLQAILALGYRIERPAKPERS